MSGNTLRREVLRAFRQLHYTRRSVFRDDTHALNAARLKINEEFKKNKSVGDLGAIHEMIIFANAVEEELRTSVIQAVETKPGRYEVRITGETLKLDNVPYNDTIPERAQTISKKDEPSPCSVGAIAAKEETKKNKSAKISP